jgi:hypothetical protein
MAGFCTTSTTLLVFTAGNVGDIRHFDPID